MLEALSAEVVEALKSGGVKAGAAYPKTPLDRSGGPFVQVGVRSAASSNAAFAGYLGSKIGEDGQSREIYGMKCAVSLALDIYASMASDNGHMACVECFDSCVQALAGLNTGLKIKEMVCGEAAPERESGMFRCPCRIEAEAFLIMESGGEQTSFTDFILKGELFR